MATTIPQKDLRNDVSDILRRAQAGEDFTITVAGRPVARLTGEHPDPWVPGARLRGIFKLPVDPGLVADLETIDYDLHDPWDGA